MNILIKSSYNPARGGHAPGDLRDAFEEAVEAVSDWPGGEPEPTVDLRGTNVPASTICGLLWNCNDAVPSSLIRGMQCLDPDFDRWTYAGAARSLKSVIAAAKLE
jgi:hypothetical protein